MKFEELKEVFVDTLNCDADKVTMEASLTDDLQADSLDAVELNRGGYLQLSVCPRRIRE